MATAFQEIGLAGVDVRRQPPAITAVSVQRRIDAPCGDRFEGRPGGRSPGPYRRVQPFRRHVECDQNGQCRHQRHTPARQRLGELVTSGMADPESSAGVEVQGTADAQEPAEDAPRAACLRCLRPGQLRRGGLLLCHQLFKQPGRRRHLRLVLVAPVRDAGIASRRMRAGNRAGKHRRMRRAAGNLLVAQRGDVPALRPLVQHGHGVALG